MIISLGPEWHKRSIRTRTAMKRDFSVMESFVGNMSCLCVNSITYNLIFVSLQSFWRSVKNVDQADTSYSLKSHLIWASLVDHCGAAQILVWWRGSSILIAHTIALDKRIPECDTERWNVFYWLNYCSLYSAARTRFP